MKEKFVLCTTSWDDGHPMDFKVADLLAKYGLQGTFYIPMKSQRKVLTPEQVQQLSAVFEVGAHTVNHIDLLTVSDQRARQEIIESKEYLENMTSQLCSMFCFPKGHYRPKHLFMVKEAGYIAVRTVELMALSFPYTKNGILVMPTTVQVFSHSFSNYVRNCLKRLASKNFFIYIFHGRFPNWVDTAKSILRYVILKGGVFHLWGHSWEIEMHNQWRQLEEIFKIMQEYNDQMPALTNTEVCRHAQNITKSIRTAR